MDGLNEVESVASVAVESSFVTCSVAGADETLVGTRDFGGRGVEGSSDEGNNEEIMVGVVGSDVFVDVVSGSHDGSRGCLGVASDMIVDVVGGNHGRNDAGVEDNIGLSNVGGDGEVVETEGVESSLGSNAETSIVVMTTEVELRKEVEDQALVDGVRDEVVDVGLVDKEVVTGLEMAKEGINCVGHSSQSSVLDDEVWNPGIVSVSASCSVILETDAVQHKIAREESVAMIHVNNSSLDDKIMSVHEMIETAEVSVLDNANQTSTCPLMIGTDGGQQQDGAAVPQECLSLKDDIPGAHEIAETSCEVSVLHNVNHTSTACPMMLETDELQQEEGPSMVEERNFSSKDEIPVHTMVDTATEISFSDNPNHTSASCSLMLEADGVQQEDGAAILEENNLNSKDEIPVAHEKPETATELSVPENSHHTAASCSLTLEADGVQQEEAAVIVEESNLNSKDEIPVAHEMAETATELSVPENSDHTSASFSPMLKTDGGHLEVTRDVALLDDNNSTCKDENVGVHEMVGTASELSVPDDANHTSASCPVKFETDRVQNEVFKEEYYEFQDHHLCFKNEIPGVHETAPQVMDDSQVIDTNGTHDKSDGDSVSAFHHDDASRCKVKAVDCTISPSSDQKDANFGIHCGVEDSMEVSVLANPDLSCQHDLQIKFGSDIGVVTGHDFPGEPQHVIEQEEVPERHVEFDVKPNNENRDLCSTENNLSIKQEVSCGSAGGEDIVPESTHEHLSDVDRGDWIVMDYEDVFDVKGEAAGLDAPMEDICCTWNTGDFSGVPMTGDKELAQSDLSMPEVHEQLVTGDTEALASKEDENFVGLSDGNKFQQETEKLEALDGGSAEKAIPENTLVPSGEQVITTAACSVRSHESIIKEEDNFSGRNPQSAVEMLDTSGTDSTVEGSVPSETEKEDALIQANQISGHECQRDNKVCVEETFGSPNSHVECKNEDETAQANQKIGHELHEDEGALGSPESHAHISAGSIDEGNSDGVFQDGNQNMDMSADVQEDETMDTSICEVASFAEVSNQISSHELHGDDKISIEGACDLPTSLVQTSDEYSVSAEGNNDSVFPYGSQKLNISADIQESETMEAPICEVASSAGGSGLVIGMEDEDPKTIGEDNLLAVVPQTSSVDDQPSLIFGEHHADGVLNDSGQPITSERDTGMNQSEILEEGNIQSSSEPSLVGEQCADRGQDDREQTMGVKNDASEIDRSEVQEEEKFQSSNPLSVHQLGYFGPAETEGEFAVSDLVWGKVRSHPWWPGQIFDPSDASDRAVKYLKKDSYLVAYFGDGTFAWNDASVLKPFRPHFSQIVKQRNSEVMRIAINSALDEVSRRVELGLSCSCTPKDVYEKIECQIVENAGIREESSRRDGVDETSRAALFEPDKLLEHIRVSARSPLDLSDRLELAIAKAQLSSFCHFKGYRPPPLFEAIETSFEDDPRTLTDKPDGEIMDVEPVSSGTSACHRQKESMNESLQTKKERSLSELMVYTEFSPDEEEDGTDGKPLSKSVGVSSGKKRKAVDSAGDGLDRRVSIYAAKVSTTLSSPKPPSFKVGDCIRRVATQLTGAASGLKSNNGQQPVVDAFLQPCNSSPCGNVDFTPESSTLADMLSQLQLAARDPKKAYGLVKNIIVFFTDFRKSVVSKHAVSRSGGNRKRKAPQAVGGSTEEFEFDDVNDSYWKDKAIENYTDEQLLQNGDKSDYGYQPIVSRPAKMHKPARRAYTRKQYSTESYATLADVPMEDDHGMKQETSPAPAKIQKPTRRPYNRKQYSTESYETLADEPLEVDQSMKRDTSSPAELIMKFVEGSHIPSQISLNNMFRRFGPLKEYETEVDQNNCRARVIFKKGVDAEVAYSSAGTFSIFGSMNVTYQLSYSPSSTLFEMPLLISQGQEEAS